MLKRTKGYLLLTLLVLTGLGGRIHSDSLSGKERRFLTSHLKETKTGLIKAVEGLTDAQLNFKPSAEQWSIKECVQHIALSEANLWTWAESTLKETPNPEKRNDIKVKDEEVVAKVSSRENRVKTTETLEPASSKWSSANEALEAFKESRGALLKYVKTTTEDVRSHVTQSHMGSIDVYQVMLLISAHTARHIKQIEEIKTAQHFPK
jgi:hypothetical protein